MKKLTTLAAKPVSATNEHKFRTLEELVDYMGELHTSASELTKLLQKYQILFKRQVAPETAATTFKVNRKGSVPNATGDKVDTFVIPNLKGIRKNFDIMQSLYDKREILDTLEVTINHNFRDAPGRAAAAKSLVAIRKSIEKKTDAAMDFLNEVAIKHCPDKFKAIVEPMIAKIVEKLDGNFSDVDDEIYVTTQDDPDGKTTMVFTHYVGFDDLKDDTGFSHPEFWIAFTAKIDSFSRMLMWVNVLPKFVVPGKFKPGHKFTDMATGIRAVDALLELENFSDVLEKVKMPVTKEDVKTENFQAKKWIKDIAVGEDTITIDFNTQVNKKNLDEAIRRVWADIRGLFAPRIKARVKYKVVPRGTQYSAIFTLVMPETDEQSKERIDHNKLQLLKDHLGVDDSDLRKIAQMINR